ncbi:MULTISPECIES: acyl-CoA dehydrogenase family protein [unclassified Pseudomonas]|jgi:alkylation response protein AidB-like acyl-CoA dehydrogenase|uniref:acyl-CoA dehydrogenase family protein n=1 Tax=unclassified Pseudomonas TaxID=196821 RepID=UPI00069F75F3|nr:MULTISPECIES: acyl-CoA dehydrogenase family protein [unclassified Pseudomonas]WPN45549.1 acyl-CoA dehydrogenase family protein [Pseudomonas sp. P8_241]
MDFELSEDQRAIAQMADGLFVDHCHDDYMRQWDTSGEPMMAPLWALCIETGLHALAIPEEHGGSGLGMTELMLVLQAQGKALAQVPLWRHQLAAATLARFGADDSAEWVAKAASGEVLLSLSIDGLSSARGIELQAQANVGGWSINGRVAALSLGDQARAALVLVQAEGQPRLLLLDLAAPEIQRVSAVLTHGEAVADLHIEGLTVDASALLPTEAVAWLELRSVAALAALQLGVSEEQIRRTVEYVSERRQFERSIGSFQAVQMSMADNHIAVEALRTVLWQLAYRIDADLQAPSEALATAWMACEAGHRIGHVAQHVHGGIGVDLTYPIHRFLYWSRGLCLALGGSAASLERLGDWLNDNDKLGWKYDLEEHQAL